MVTRLLWMGAPALYWGENLVRGFGGQMLSCSETSLLNWTGWILKDTKQDLREMCPPLYRHPLPSCSNLSDYVVGQRLARVKVPCDRKVGSRPCLSSPLFMFELRSQLWINSVSSIIDYWSPCSSPATDHFNGTFCLKVWTVGSKSDQIQQTVVHAHLTRDLIMEEDPWMVFLSNMLSPNIAL